MALAAGPLLVAAQTRDPFLGRVSSVYLLGVQGGLVVGGPAGGIVAGAWGVTAPFWFAFAGSAALVAALWRQLPLITHADEAQLTRGAPGTRPQDPAS